MWNGKKLNDIRHKLLTDRDHIRECKDCRYTELVPDEDRIDGITDRLMLYCKDRVEVSV